MELPINQIVKGHVNEILGLNRDISKVRLEICLNCPIYSSKFGGWCNPSLWINPETDEVSSTARKGYIRGCGCRVSAKTTLPNANCPAGKW